MLNKILAVLAVACLIVCGIAAPASADNAWGGLYVTGGSTGQSLSTTAAKLTAFTAALPSSTSDGDQSIVAAVSDDQVALVAGGVYEIRWSYSGTADATTRVTYSLRDGSTAITGATASVNHVASTAMGASITFLYRPTSSATISVYAVAASGTPSLTVIDSQLVIVRIK